MKFITDITKCTGCSACVNVCPQNCITMQQNSEGFLYPVFEQTKCIICGLCEQVCPLNNHQNFKQTSQEYYAFQYLKDDFKLQSTSGGFFAAVANYIIGHNGKVYAVGFKENVYVAHKCVMENSEIYDLCGSKYVQSDLNNTFANIKNDLISMTFVLFVGTPCQIAGLHSYLNCFPIDKSRLYSIELKCYGVSSPRLFKKYIEYLEAVYHEKIISVNFRDKTFGYTTTTVKVHMEGDKSVLNNYMVKSYSKTFFSGLNIRKCCYNCSFRDYQYSNADFIAGDFHGISKFSKEMDDDLGTTLVIAKSEKGKKLLSKLQSVKFFALHNYIEDIPKNPKLNDKRDAFFEDAITIPWEKLISKYCPNSLWDMMASVFKPVIMKFPFSKVIFNIIRRINTIKYKIKTK